MPWSTCNQKGFLIESKLNGFLWGFLLHLDLEIFIGERGDKVNWAFYSITFCKMFLNSILMSVSICTQKEFVIESKLNGFLGVLLLLLDLACRYFHGLLTGRLYLLFYCLFTHLFIYLFILVYLYIYSYLCMFIYIYIYIWLFIYLFYLSAAILKKPLAIFKRCFGKVLPLGWGRRGVILFSYFFFFLQIWF